MPNDGKVNFDAFQVSIIGYETSLLQKSYCFQAWWHIVKNRAVIWHALFQINANHIKVVWVFTKLASKFKAPNMALHFYYLAYKRDK
jgi:hypothetical protein